MVVQDITIELPPTLPPSTKKTRPPSRNTASLCGGATGTRTPDPLLAKRQHGCAPHCTRLYDRTLMRSIEAAQCTNLHGNAPALLPSLLPPASLNVTLLDVALIYCQANCLSDEKAPRAFVNTLRPALISATGSNEDTPQRGIESNNLFATYPMEGERDVRRPRWRPSALRSISGWH
jgi:hypothetical protein